MTNHEWNWVPLLHHRLCLCPRTLLTNRLWTDNSNLLKLFYWMDQVTILHMSRQLCCRGMCKIITWSDHNFLWKTQFFFQDFGLWAHKILMKRALEAVGTLAGCTSLYILSVFVLCVGGKHSLQDTVSLMVIHCKILCLWWLVCKRHWSAFCLVCTNSST